MNNYLSIIVPVYNVEAYLHQCIDSIIHQTFKEIEIILINDGSTDNSPQICDDYAKKDNRIKVIHQKNAGVSVARNKGIEAATGEYLTFVDSDDWLEPKMYEEMIAKEKSDVVMCDFLNIQGDAETKITAEIRSGYYDRNDIIEELFPTLIVREDFGRIPIVSVWSCLFKRTLFTETKIRFEPLLKYSEDYLFMAEVMLKAQSFFYLKGEYFYNYRQYEESRSKKFQPEWWDHLILLNNKLKKVLLANREFDFTNQIKLQLLHSALLVSSRVSKNEAIAYSQKNSELGRIFSYIKNEKNFSGLDFSKQKLGLRAVLFMMKNNLPTLYFTYINLVEKLKK